MSGCNTLKFSGNSFGVELGASFDSCESCDCGVESVEVEDKNDVEIKKSYYLSNEDCSFIVLFWVRNLSLLCCFPVGLCKIIMEFAQVCYFVDLCIMCFCIAFCVSRFILVSNFFRLCV